MKSILIVEDEFDVQQVIADVLRDEGYEVSTCANGREALARMKDHPPDAVLMDVMLPLLSGVQVIETMRHTPPLASIPVILMSEVAPRVPSPEPWQVFLKKPFRLEQLVAAVAQVCGPA